MVEQRESEGSGISGINIPVSYSVPFQLLSLNLDSLLTSLSIVMYCYSSTIRYNVHESDIWPRRLQNLLQ